MINLDAVTDSKLGVGFEEWGEGKGGRFNPSQPIKRMLPKYPISGTPLGRGQPAQGHPRPQCNARPDDSYSLKLFKNIPTKFRESPSKCSAAHPKITLWRNIPASHSRNLVGNMCLKSPGTDVGAAGFESVSQDF